VSFDADEAETIPLPDIQLGSALGFDYIPADAILPPPGAAAAVLEASTWIMMLAGFCGLGALAFRRAAPQPARPLPKGAESGEIALGAPFNALGLVNGPIGKRG
jgi:hypothetical protein